MLIQTWFTEYMMVIKIIFLIYWVKKTVLQKLISPVSFLLFNVAIKEWKIIYVNINVAYITFLSDSPGLDSIGVRCFKDYLGVSCWGGEENPLICRMGIDLQALCSTFFLSQARLAFWSCSVSNPRLSGDGTGRWDWAEARLTHPNPWVVGS